MKIKNTLHVLGLSAATTVCVLANGAVAQSDDNPHAGKDLATAATNPVGSANQLQFQNLFIEDSNNASGSDANTFIIQPIVTFDLPEGSYF